MIFSFYFLRADFEANRVVCSRFEIAMRALIIKTHFPSIAEASTVRMKHLATICSHQVVIIILCNSTQICSFVKFFRFLLFARISKFHFIVFLPRCLNINIHILQRLSMILLLFSRFNYSMTTRGRAHNIQSHVARTQRENCISN